MIPFFQFLKYLLLSFCHWDRVNQVVGEAETITALATAEMVLK